MAGFVGSLGPFFGSSAEIDLVVLCGSTNGGLGTTGELESTGFTGAISGSLTSDLLSDLASGFGDGEEDAVDDGEDEGEDDGVGDADGDGDGDAAGEGFDTAPFGDAPGSRPENPCLLSKTNNDCPFHSLPDVLSGRSDLEM